MTRSLKMKMIVGNGIDNWRNFLLMMRHSLQMMEWATLFLLRRRLLLRRLLLRLRRRRLLLRRLLLHRLPLPHLLLFKLK